MKPLLEVFYQPGELFASLPDRKRAWVRPVIVDALLVTLISALAGHYIGLGNILRQQLEAFHMPPEQMEQAIAKATSLAGVYRGYAFTAIGVPCVLLVTAGVLQVFAMMTSRTPKFGTMYSMVSLAFFPYWLISCVMTALILVISPDPTSLDPRNLLATNVGAFVNKDSVSKGMYALLSSLDLLSFVEMGLLALGFARLTRSSVPAGLGAVLVLWALYVSAKMAMSAIF